MREMQEQTSRLVTFSWLWVTAPLVLVVVGLVLLGHPPGGPDWVVWVPMAAVLVFQALRLRARLRNARQEQALRRGLPRPAEPRPPSDS
jgi:hypothetical protein